MSVPRNSLLKLDDLGMYAGLDRRPGESATQFRMRLQQANRRLSGMTLHGITDALCTTFGLNQINLLTVNVSVPIQLEVQDIQMVVSGTTGIHTIPLVEQSEDGFWGYFTIKDLANQLNTISGIGTVYTTALSGVPALLLENQSSLKFVSSELVLPSNVFQLGYYEHRNVSAGSVLPGSIYFDDQDAFRFQISGIPRQTGEWSVSSTGQIRVFDLPSQPFHVSYAYNTLTAGASMNLLGAATKVIGLTSPSVLNGLYSENGRSALLNSFLAELFKTDQTYWGQ